MSRPRPVSRHSYVKVNEPLGWLRGPDLRRNYLSLFLIQLTIALVGVVVTLASAMAFGTRLQRRRKYNFHGGDDWEKGHEEPFSVMIRLAPSICSATVFFAFFQLAYAMMKPRYARHVFLVSHLFCIVSMLSLFVYAAVMLVDILKFPNGAIGILDSTLDKEIHVLDNRTGPFHEIVPIHDKTERSKRGEKQKNATISCCGAYSTQTETIMHREEAAFLRYLYNDTCPNVEMRQFNETCSRAESCFYKDASIYGNRVVLFLVYTFASAVSAVATVIIVIRRDRKDAEANPMGHLDESQLVPESPAPSIIFSKPTTPPIDSPIEAPLALKEKTT